MLSQKHSKDRKMIDRKMLAVARSRSPQLPWHDAKRHFSVFHFSVRAFVQANLTVPSEESFAKLDFYLSLHMWSIKSGII
jgi:hypothetical protein